MSGRLRFIYEGPAVSDPGSFVCIKIKPYLGDRSVSVRIVARYLRD